MLEGGHLACSGIYANSLTKQPPHDLVSGSRIARCCALPAEHVQRDTEGEVGAPRQRRGAKESRNVDCLARSAAAVRQAEPQQTDIWWIDEAITQRFLVFG